MKRKLLICSRSSSPHGGADQIVATLARELPRYGWETLLGLTVGSKYNRIEPYRAVLGEDLPIIPLDGTSGTQHSRIRSIQRAIREHKPDIVLSMRVFDTYRATLLEKRGASDGPRLVVGVRALELPYLRDCRAWRECIDGCVTSGKLIADLCTTVSGLPSERVVSIGGGVHKPVCSRAADRSGNGIRLGYAGRLNNDQKRILDLIPFVEYLEQRGVKYTMTIAGSGPSEAALRDALRSREHSGVVRFLGWKSRSELYHDFYPYLDCFLHFAAWEGMTIAPREAMAHGVVPVISRFEGAVTEGQFKEGVNALTFAVGDTEGAVSCVQRLSEDVSLFESLSRCASASQEGINSHEGALRGWAAFFDRVSELPTTRGLPPASSRKDSGRLSGMNLPPVIEDYLRKILGRPVQHGSAGSEWPTNSGQRFVPDIKDDVEAYVKAAEAIVSPQENDGAGVSRR